MEILLYLFIAWIITRLPVVGKYVRLIYTIIHEISHVVMAKMTGGKGYRIILNRDTSGLAITGSSSWISRILTAYFGYTGSSLMALFVFYLLQEGRFVTVIYLFFGIAMTAIFLWVRNLFGFIWAATFIFLLWLLIDKQLDVLYKHVGYLLGSVLLIESIISAAHIMVISLSKPKEAGDATSLQKSTMIPALFWGILFFGQSVYVGFKIMNEYFIE